MFTTRLAVAALAIVLVLAGGGFMLSHFIGPESGGPSPTPLASNSASPVPSSAPSPSSALPTITASDAGKTLPAGIYSVEGFAVPFSVTLPAGWTANPFTRNHLGFALTSDGSDNIGLIVMDKVYPDPCDTAGGPQVIGSGVDALVAAFSSMPKFEVTDVSDVTVGGASGKSFLISNSVKLFAPRCSEEMLSIGTYDQDGEDVDVQMFGKEADRFWVLDVNGTRVLIAITDGHLEATRPVFDSLTFDGASSG